MLRESETVTPCRKDNVVTTANYISSDIVNIICITTHSMIVAIYII